HSVTEGVVHRDPALHRRHRGQWEHTGAVTGRVDSGPGGAGHTVDDDVSGVADAHTGLLQTEVLGVRNRTDGHATVAAADATAMRQWEPATRRPSASTTSTPDSVRVTDAARERERTFMPLLRNTNSSTSAASSSWPGRTFSRDDTRVTSVPRAR